jgi:hypothetical protein
MEERPMTVFVTEPKQRGKGMLKPEAVREPYTSGDYLDHLIRAHPDAIYYTDDTSEWDAAPTVTTTVEHQIFAFGHAMIPLFGQSDPSGSDGYTPGAWDEVRAAYLDGHLSEAAYETLREAVIPPVGADEREAGKLRSRSAVSPVFKSRKTAQAMLALRDFKTGEAEVRTRTVTTSTTPWTTLTEESK